MNGESYKIIYLSIDVLTFSLHTNRFLLPIMHGLDTTIHDLMLWLFFCVCFCELHSNIVHN